MKTHYEVLKVGPNAPQELIAESAKALLLLLQPRQNASEAAQQEYLSVARAYKVLSDPLLRAAYDADLHSQPASNANPAPQTEPEPVVRSAQSKPAYAAQDNGEFMAGYGIDPESLSKVKKGEASLAKAFWYYTVLLPVAWFIVSLTVFSIFSPSQNFFNNITGSSMLAICGYSLFYSMPAIWRSSRHSSVSPFWRRTTKAVTILLLVCFILTALLLMVYASAQRSVSKNSSFTSGDVVQENRIDLPSAVLDEDQSSNTVQVSSEADQTTAHYNAIYAAHPDTDNIVESSEFKAWISSLKSEWRQEYERVLKEGTADQVIAMLSSYKIAKSYNAKSK